MHKNTLLTLDLTTIWLRDISCCSLSCKILKSWLKSPLCILFLLRGPDCSGVCTPAVVSWPGQPALSRLLSDAYLSEAQVYLRGVYLKPATHLQKLRGAPVSHQWESTDRDRGLPAAYDIQAGEEREVRAGTRGKLRKSKSESRHGVRSQGRGRRIKEEDDKVRGNREIRLTNIL